MRQELLGISRVRIELLFVDGCPGHERLVPLVRELAASTGTERTALERRHG